jgi:hypothetical protein
LQSQFKFKAGSIYLAFVLLIASCGTPDNKASLPELIDRVCEIMEPIGYDFTESSIQALDESVQRQLLDDIAEIEKISPSRLEVPLETLCS